MALFSASRSLGRRFPKVTPLLGRYASSHAKSTPTHDPDSAQPQTHLTTLDNKLRVASENWGSPTCTVGLFLDVGSRYDTDATSGISHFLEHVAFKGTNKRSQKDIEAQADERGAYLKAHTGRELAALLVKCHRKDIPWAVELLSEVVKNTTFEDSVVEHEKKVIRQEMEDLEGNLREVVFDYLHATAFQGTPLGRPIIGQPETVQALTKAHLSQFVKEHYKAPRMVLSVAGGVDHSEVVDLAKKHLSDVSLSYEDGPIPVRLPCRYTGSEIRDRDDAYPIAHVAMAVEGPGWTDADTIVLSVANAVNGKWDLQTGGGNLVASNFIQSSFNTHYCHSFDNFLICYHDTSLWGTYFTGPRENLFRVAEHNVREWIRLCTTVTDFEVQRAKNTLKTNILNQYADGGMSHACEEIGRHVLVYGRRIPVEELLQRIELVNANKVRDVLFQRVYNKDPALGSFGPVEGLTEYVRLRGNMFWYRK